METGAPWEVPARGEQVTLPDDQSQTFDASQASSVELEDGAKIDAPAQTVAASGNVTVSTAAVVELIEESDAKVVGYGYDIKASDNQGQDITQLNGSVKNSDIDNDTPIRIKNRIEYQRFERTMCRSHGRRDRSYNGI